VNKRDVGGLIFSYSPSRTSPATAYWSTPAETPVDYQINWALADESYSTGTDNNAYTTDTRYTMYYLEHARHKARVRARYDDGSFGPWSEGTFGGPQ